MLKSSLFLLFTIGGSFAFLVPICDFKKCHNLASQLSLFSPENVLPTQERLLTICPAIMEVMRCERQEWNNCLGEDLSNFLTSDNKTIEAMANVYLGVAELFTELCDDTSAFHKVYAENVVCMKSVSMSTLTQAVCTLEATALSADYKNGQIVSKEKSTCMQTAHIFACITGEILKECGEEARATTVEMVKKTKLLKYAVCTMEDLEELKTTYLDFLKQETETRNVFARAFDLRKK